VNETETLNLQMSLWSATISLSGDICISERVQSTIYRS